MRGAAILCFSITLAAGLSVGLTSSLSGRLGGIQAIPIDDIVRNFSAFAISEYEKKIDSLNGLRLIKVINASEQLVNGIFYEINMVVGFTYCSRQKHAEITTLKEKEAQCPFRENMDYHCWMKIFQEIPIVEEHVVELTEHKCIMGSTGFPETSNLHSPAESRRRLHRLQSASHFKKFVKRFGRNYASADEYERRFEIFRNNMKKVQFLRETERGTGRYGASVFADFTEEEFKTRLGFKRELKGDDVHWPAADIPDVSLPAEFDWRKKGAVTPVKNQGSCGSCWAFSVTGNVEGLWFLKHKELIPLSEQELVDCDKRDDGCNGGLPENAYKSIIELGGLESEKDYSYDGEDEKCIFKKRKVVAGIDKAVEISKNETKMAQFLITQAPISIGLNANAMQFYMGGVSHPFKFMCSPGSIDHGVLIVGYGIHHYPLFHKELPFWIIKNSWGKNWGEQGYYRLYRGDGSCGVNQMTSSAVITTKDEQTIF